MPKDVESLSIDGLARKALDEADGDWEKAAIVFRAWVDEDPDLRAALLEPFLEKGIWRAIRRAAEHQRRPGRVGTSAGDSAGLKAMAETYFSYPLMGGLKLGDATITKLEVERDMHKQFASSNHIKARRFQLIIDVMTKKRASREKTVRELMTHEKLLELWEEAKNE